MQTFKRHLHNIRRYKNSIALINHTNGTKIWSWHWNAQHIHVMHTVHFNSMGSGCYRLVLVVLVPMEVLNLVFSI